MNGQIIEITLITKQAGYEKSFMQDVRVEINKFQRAGYNVEIQYSNTTNSLSVMIIARKKEND